LDRPVEKRLTKNQPQQTGTQILLEATNVLARRAGIGSLDAARLLRPFIDGDVASVKEHAVRESWRISDRYGFHIYDATVVASAIGARCPTLYTEDLQHDQRIESVRF
jgi:predicted nucleic acid-binding protein